MEKHLSIMDKPDDIQIGPYTVGTLSTTIGQYRYWLAWGLRDSECVICKKKLGLGRLMGMDIGGGGYFHHDCSTESQENLALYIW